MIDQRSVFKGLSRFAVVGTTLLTATAVAQQAQLTPPPNRSTPAEANELRETWNDRVSQGAPVAAIREFDGWGLGAAMPLPRSEHAVAEFEGKVWVLGGYPPGRLPSHLFQI